jgi:hypothetical protein
MDLSIGCRLELVCEVATPMLALVHPHASVVADLQGPEPVVLQPDRPVEGLTYRQGNRWCRFIAASGTTTFRYDATIRRQDPSSFRGAAQPPNAASVLGQRRPS